MVWRRVCRPRSVHPRVAVPVGVVGADHSVDGAESRSSCALCTPIPRVRVASASPGVPSRERDQMNINLVGRPDRSATIEENPDGMSDIADVTHTVQDAVRGRQGAWRELYRRYNPLVVATARRFRLPPTSIDDVSQTVWGLLVTRLGQIREPRALPAWIVTTTRNEVYRVLRADARCTPSDPMSDPRLELVDDAEPGADLYQAELKRELDELLDELSTTHRQLMRLLMADPQPSYAEISRRLHIPVGSIGPTRSRCLARLRAHSRRRGVVLAEAA